MQHALGSELRAHTSRDAARGSGCSRCGEAGSTGAFLARRVLRPRHESRRHRLSSSTISATGSPTSIAVTGQHVRHRPPFVNRPWVASAAGREAMLGTDARLRALRPDGVAGRARRVPPDSGVRRDHDSGRAEVRARDQARRVGSNPRGVGGASLPGGRPHPPLVPGRPVVERRSSFRRFRMRPRGAGAVHRRVLEDGARRGSGDGSRETGMTAGDRRWRPPATG